MTAPGAPAGNDKTTLWGVLGIVFAFCCTPLAIVFGVLSLTESKKHNTSPVLAYIALGIAAVSLLVSIILIATGNVLG